MLEEVLENIKKELRDSIEQEKQIDVRKQEVEAELKEINAEISKLEKENSKLLPTIHKKRNTIIAFFVKNFSRQYKEATQKEAENRSKLDELRKKESELSKEKEAINLKNPTSVEETIKNKEKELEKLEDKETAIKTAISRNPELMANPEFMKDLLSEDLSYIKYDNSNNPMVYQAYLHKIREILEEKIKRPAENTWVTNVVLDRVKTISEEINNPQEVEKGKYKIPHRFLFESLRKSSEYDLDGIEQSPKIDFAVDSSKYMDFDGEYSEEYGKSIESLYEDKDKYLLMHRVNASFFRAEEEYATEKEENIFRDGLRASGQGAGCVNALHRTTTGNYQREGTFLNMIVPDYTVLIMIPKEAFKEGSNIPIWGLDRPEADEDHLGYILPEYIYGVIDPNTEKIEKNPIPLEQRTTYKYKFLNNQLECMDDRITE